MAKFSQQFLARLGTPGLFEQGLMNLAQDVSGFPAQLREEKKQKKIADIYSAAMQPGATSTQMFQTAQQLLAEGKQQEALTLLTQARELEAKEKTEKTETTQGRGKGELMALANDPEFDLNNLKMRSGYIGMADSFGISRADAIQIALDARQKRQGGDKQTFASAGRYKDKDNNIYVATEVRTKGGGVRIDYSPITPDAPETPVGKLTPIGGAYGETAPERLERGIEAASEETKAEQFSKSQQVAVDNLPKIEVAIGNAERSLELLQEIRTGGFTTAIVRSAQQFLGVEPENQAEFNLLAGKTVLDNLSKFEGAISEGERQYLERLYQSLERSGGANQAILENLLQEAQFLLADTKVKATASNYRDYLETRPTFSSVTSRDKGTKKVNFDELK